MIGEIISLKPSHILRARFIPSLTSVPRPKMLTSNMCKDAMIYITTLLHFPFSASHKFVSPHRQRQWFWWVEFQSIRELSFYLDLISVYGGGGSEGIPEDVPCVATEFWAGLDLDAWARTWASNSDRLRFKNSCLFFHSCWLAANPSFWAGGGGGSVILVTRYAVEASATP
jgi:hypothetical protein